MTRLFKKELRLLEAVLVAIFALYCLTPVAAQDRTKDPNGHPRDTSRIAKDFVMFHAQTAFVPDDITIALRPRIISIDRYDASVPELYWFLFDRLQVDGSIGLSDTMQSVSLGAKVYLFDRRNTRFSLRYQFDAFDKDFDLEDPARFHNISLLYSMWMGQLLFNAEVGYLASDNGPRQRMLFNFGIAYPLYKKYTLLIECQNYERQDDYYSNTAMFGLRYDFTPWLHMDLGYMSRWNNVGIDSGTWLGVMLTY